jgi:hypothetical protein
VAGLALGALVASSQPVVRRAGAGLRAAAAGQLCRPAVPPGYCYSNYQGAYVPCGRGAPVQYAQPQPYYGY